MVKIYRFQRLMIAAAVIIWAVFAGRLVYKGIKGETMDVVDTSVSYTHLTLPTT